MMWEWGAPCSMGNCSIFSEPTSRGTAAGRAASACCLLLSAGKTGDLSLDIRRALVPH